MPHPTRRTVLAGVAAAPTALAQTTTQNPEAQPPLDLALVREFVSKSHGDLKSVREMVKKEARLIYASRDWGAGDWETGLNAASHMGRRDIAEFLLDSGARPDAPAVFM